jgi:hypothetical protein
MPTLDQITKTGMISLDSSSQVSMSMFSLGEQMVAEMFAEAINSQRITVTDAYFNFWSYVNKNVELKHHPVQLIGERVDSYTEFSTMGTFKEYVRTGKYSLRDIYVKWWGYIFSKDDEFKPLPKPNEARMLIDSWNRVVKSASSQLEGNYVFELFKVGTSCFGLEKKEMDIYPNPVIKDLLFLAEIVGRSNISEEYHEKIAEYIAGFVGPPRFAFSLNENLFTALMLTKSKPSFDKLHWFMSHNEMDNSLCFGGDMDLYDYGRAMRTGTDSLTPKDMLGKFNSSLPQIRMSEEYVHLLLDFMYQNRGALNK